MSGGARLIGCLILHNNTESTQGGRRNRGGWGSRANTGKRPQLGLLPLHECAVPCCVPSVVHPPPINQELNFRWCLTFLVIGRGWEAYVVFTFLLKSLGAGAHEQIIWARVYAFAAACGGCLVFGRVILLWNGWGPGRLSRALGRECGRVLLLVSGVYFW